MEEGGTGRTHIQREAERTILKDGDCGFRCIPFINSLIPFFDFVHLRDFLFLYCKTIRTLTRRVMAPKVHVEWVMITEDMFTSYKKSEKYKGNVISSLWSQIYPMIIYCFFLLF